MAQKSDLLKEKERLLKKLKDLRIEFNAYLQGEGILAGHEHSLHESHETKVKLIEQKITIIQAQIEGTSQKPVKVKASIDGQKQTFSISENPLSDEVNAISSKTPIGKALLSMKKGEKRIIEVPSGPVKLTRLS